LDEATPYPKFLQCWAARKIKDLVVQHNVAKLQSGEVPRDERQLLQLEAIVIVA